MSRYLSAELLRARGSALQWLPLLAVPLVLVTYALASVTDPREDAVGVLMWQAIYLTGMAAPLAALFGAVAEAREKKARCGGTQWRPVSMRRQRAARLAVVLLSLAVFHVLNFGGTWLLTASRPGSGTILLLGALAFAGAIGLAGLGAALARVSNLIVAVAVFFVWQIVGTLKPFAEGEHWWVWPMSWPVRLVLPVLGVHQNAVPLEPGSPLAAEKPWLALGLCIALAAVGAAAAVFTPGWTGRGRGRREAKSAVSAAVPAPAVARRGSRRPRPLRAMTSAGLTPALAGCVALSVVAMGLTCLIYPASYVHGLFSFVILPLGAGLLPVLVWPQVEGAWAVMRVEYARSARVLLLWCLLCALAVCFAASLFGLAAGGTLVDETRRFLVAALVGYVVLLLSFLVLLRTGAAAAVATVVVLAIFSVTLGGDVLAQTPLWIVALPSWPETAEGAGRLGTALALGGVLAVLLHWRAERALGRRVG